MCCPHVLFLHYLSLLPPSSSVFSPFSRSSTHESFVAVSGPLPLLSLLLKLFSEIISENWIFVTLRFVVTISSDNYKSLPYELQLNCNLFPLFDKW